MAKAFEILKKYFMITLGTAIMGFSLSCFLACNNIISGGISGISTIINHFINIPIGIILFCINIPIFILGIFKFGSKHGAATAYGTIMLSVFVYIFEQIKNVTNEMILASLFGGLLMGIGSGIVFSFGATTGGVDIIAKIIKSKYRHFDLGKIILSFDLITIFFAIFVYKRIDVGLYSVIALWISSVIVDYVLEGLNFAKLIFVISDKSLEISKKINTELVRGATLIDGFGAYTNEHKNIVFCTIKKNEIPKFKDIVKKVDINAFFLITDVREVFGEGFLKY